MAKTNPWMSVSDLMTGLMVIFLFVAIAYIRKEQNENEQKESLIIDYVDNKRKLNDNLVSQFSSEISNGTISITGDLSMRFENAEALFENGESTLSPKFKTQIESIVPRYLNVLLDDEIKNKIREIRIEGHTDDVYSSSTNPDTIYYKNLILSQQRALNVLMFVRSLPALQNLDKEKKDLLEYWLSADGLSYGRTLDSNGEYVKVSHNSIDRNRSRRVELRIIAADEDVLNQFATKALEGK